jgi:hypothetical protein
MANRFRPTAYEAAILTVHLVALYDKETGKKSSRFRLSLKTLRLITLRGPLRDAFLDDWRGELDNLGWTAIPVDDHFAIIEKSAIDGWPRIGANRMVSLLRRLRAGREDALDELDKIAEEIDPDAPLGSDD